MTRHGRAIGLALLVFGVLAAVPVAAQEEQPAEKQPAEKQPAEEQPAEEQPAEEQPAEEQPAEEQPTDEPSSDEPSSDEPSDLPGPPRWPVAVISTGAFVMAGGGLAVFAASTIRRGAESQAAGAPENGYTQREFADAEAEANTLAAAGIGAAAVGAIVTGVGVYFHIKETREYSSPPPVGLLVAPSADGARAGVRISF